MYSLTFGLFSLAFLLLFGMFHTIFFLKRMKRDIELKQSLKKHATLLGLFGTVSLALAMYLYHFSIS